jgi:hypothetical protein
MAVKARETLDSKEISMPAFFAVVLILIGYTYLYYRVISNMADYQLKTIVSFACLIVMVGLFLLSLRYVAISFEMMLTHDRLIIERKLYFWKKTVAEIGVSEIREVLPAEKAGRVKGKTTNYTLTNLKGKQKYHIHYEQQGKICCAKIQCSTNFYNSLKKQAKIRQV